ncbi:MAG: transposase [Vicinamibacteria bacterium]
MDTTERPRMRRKWTPTDKMRIVMEGLRDPGGIGVVCRKYGVPTSQWHEWHGRLVASAEEVFKRKRNGRSTAEEDEIRASNERMKSVIAEITSENLELKKGRWPPARAH